MITPAFFVFTIWFTIQLVMYLCTKNDMTFFGSLAEIVAVILYALLLLKQDWNIMFIAIALVSTFHMIVPGRWMYVPKFANDMDVRIRLAAVTLSAAFTGIVFGAMHLLNN